MTIGSWLPERWIPQFRRGTWHEEQVVKRDHFGTYDPLVIQGGVTFETVDRKRGVKLEIEFKGGFIYVREANLALDAK